MTLWKRILVEKRVVVIPLALGHLANIAVYALVVYPLGVKSAGAEDRAAAAAQALQAAERDLAAARDLVAGQDARRAGAVDLLRQGAAGRSAVRAAADLRDAAGAGAQEQRQVHRSPPGSRADQERRAARLAQDRHGWQGDYGSVRRFIYELESAPAFVIIDDVTLAQTDPTKPLTLSLQLSTYYRLGANGN